MDQTKIFVARAKFGEGEHTVNLVCTSDHVKMHVVACWEALHMKG